MSNRKGAGNAEFVRFSRDGDQFHYLWAARRCLKLLSPTSDLVTVTIEAASPAETTRLTGVDAGTEVIDIAEYYGGEDPATARLLRYVQLKHSTVRADQPWTPSGLKKTLAGFAKRYAALSATFAARNTEQHVEFCFVSNRPVDVTLMEAIADAAAKQSAGCPHPRRPWRMEACRGNMPKIAGIRCAQWAGPLHIGFGPRPDRHSGGGYGRASARYLCEPPVCAGLLSSGYAAAG